MSAVALRWASDRCHVARSGAAGARVARVPSEWADWPTGADPLDTRPGNLPARVESPFGDGVDRGAPFPREIFRLIDALGKEVKD